MGYKTHIHMCILHTYFHRHFVPQTLMWLCQLIRHWPHKARIVCFVAPYLLHHGKQICACKPRTTCVCIYWGIVTRVFMSILHILCWPVGAVARWKHSPRCSTHSVIRLCVVFFIYKQNYELLCSLWRWIYSVKFYIEYCIIYKLKYMLMKLCIIIVISQWQSVCLSFVEMLKTLRGTDIYQYLLKTCCFKLGLNKICENYVGNAFWHIPIHTEEGGMRFIKCIFCMKVIILQFMLVVNYRHFY